MKRLILYFVLGLALGINAALAFAETIPATQTTKNQYTDYSQQLRDDTAIGVCNKIAAKYGGTDVSIAGGMYCQYKRGNFYESERYYGPSPFPVWACPDSTYTLEGENCVRNDQCPLYQGGALTDSQPMAQPAGCSCPAGTKWWPGEGCRQTGNCVAGNDAWGQSMTGGFLFKDLNSLGCVSGCEVQQKAGEYYVAKGGIYAKATETGWACRSDVTTPTGPQGKDVPDISKLDNPKPPSCANADNVVTLSSGSVVCVPGDTPSTVKPVIEKKKQVDTYPDDSKKTTETEKTTDPNTGASTTVVKVTTTGGQSGPSGTETTTHSDSGSDTDGDGVGDGEGCDPKKDFCGGPETGGLYSKKDKTFQSVFTQFKDGISQSPVVMAANNYLTASVPAGACPVWVVTVPLLEVTLNISEHFCTPAAVSTMAMIGYIILAGVSFLAFKWAIL